MFSVKCNKIIKLGAQTLSQAAACHVSCYEWNRQQSSIAWPPLNHLWENIVIDYAVDDIA